MKKRILKIPLLMIFIVSLAFFKAGATDTNLEKRIESIADGSFLTEEDFGKETSLEAIDALNPQSLIVLAADGIKKTFAEYREFFLSLTVIIILAAFTEVFSSNLGSGSKICEYISVFALILICLGITERVLTSVTEFLSKHCAVMTSLSSSLCLLLGASGSATTSVSSSASAAFIISFIQICCVRILLPASEIVLVLSCMGAVSRGFDLSGVTKQITSFCTFGTGLVFAVFLSVHALAVNVSGSADTLAFKSIRFTFSRLVPVAGGMISESLKTVLAGINLIKNASGGIGIAYIIYSAFPTVLPVIAVKCILSLGHSLAGMLNIKKHASLLSGFNQALNLIFAVCIFAVFGGIIILAVFMGNTVNV